MAGKVGDDQEAVRLGQFAGLLVVGFNRFKFVAQILLDDVFNVLGDFFQLLLDLSRLGPDAASHQGLLVVPGMHEAGKVFPQADRIEEHESNLTG